MNLDVTLTLEEAGALRNTVPGPDLVNGKNKLDAAIAAAIENDGNAHGPKTKAEIIQALTLASETAQGKGDQGAWDVWSVVTYLLACEQDRGDEAAFLTKEHS